MVSIIIYIQDALNAGIYVREARALKVSVWVCPSENKLSTLSVRLFLVPICWLKIFLSNSTSKNVDLITTILKIILRGSSLMIHLDIIIAYW